MNLKVRSHLCSPLLLYFARRKLTSFTAFIRELFVSDGLYVLLQPDKKRKNSDHWIPDLSKTPSHLKDLTLAEFPSPNCPWSLSGPQFPQPTAIQQRYCYPKGNHEYSSCKGGALWTMYERSGKEDLQFRLLHVYHSAKRAINKGVSPQIDDPRRRNTPASTPRRRRRSANSKSGRSPYSQSSCATPRSIHTTVTESPLNLPRHVTTFRPMSHSDMTRIDESNHSSFVSPYTAEQEFLGHPFHSIASFELDSVDPSPFVDPDFTLIENIFKKDDNGTTANPITLDQAEESQLFLGANTKDDVDAYWKDPLFPIVMKSSVDENDDACESLKHKLYFIRQRIGDLIASAPEKEATVDIVVSWARHIAASALGVHNKTANRASSKPTTLDSGPSRASSKSKRKIRRCQLLTKDGKEMPWSVLDDALVCRLRFSLGPRWSMIAPLLPNRTIIEIKTRYQFLKHRFDRCLKTVPLTKLLVGRIQALKQSVPLANGGADVNILQHLADYMCNGDQAVLDGDYFFGPFRQVTSTGELCARCGLAMPSFETGRSVCEKTGWCETCTQLSVCVSENLLRHIHLVKKAPGIKLE